MKKLFIILSICILSITGNAQHHGLLSRGHYVPEKLQALVIEESECPEMKDSTTWQASIPFENKNYVFEITNSRTSTQFVELSKTRMQPAYKKILGIPTYFILWTAMLVLL